MVVVGTEGSNVRGIVKEESKRKGDFLDVKSGAQGMDSR